jgi:hypothetical protein
VTTLYQVLIAAVAYGAAGYLVNRVRAVRGKGGSGGTRYFSNYGQIMVYKAEMAQQYINRQILKMGWVWLAICGPALAYDFGIAGGYDVKAHVLAVLACLPLGIIVAAVGHRRIADAPRVDEKTREDIMAVMSGLPAEEQLGFLRQFMPDMEKYARKSNVRILLAAAITTLVLIGLGYLVLWVSGFDQGWFIGSLIAWVIIDLIVYSVAPYASS